MLAVAGSMLLGYGSRRVVREAGRRLGLVELPVKGLVIERPVFALFRKPGARRLMARAKRKSQSL